MEALKITEKIIVENALEDKKKKPGLSANWPSNNWALDDTCIWTDFRQGKKVNVSLKGIDYGQSNTVRFCTVTHGPLIGSFKL